MKHIVFTERLLVIRIYLKSYLQVCFIYLLTLMEKKILQQFYSSTFEEKHHNQCIVKEKIKSARLRIQLFDLLIYSIEIHVIKTDHQPSVQTTEISHHISIDSVI